VALVVLIGMPGSGKTTVGTATAEALEVAFCDTDAVVEADAGRSVAEIFGEDGEAQFRDLELAALRRCLAERAVVATGGGVVGSEAARAALAREVCVYLRADVETLVHRVSSMGRPLLADDPGGSLARLAAAREAHYRALASVELDASRSVESLAAEIAQLVEATQ
jgi:shikimate kinase